jgi:sugar lactone lactonase YvrE
MERHMSCIPVEIVSLKMHESQLPVSAADAVHGTQEGTSRGASYRRLSGAARLALRCGRDWMLALAVLLLTATGAQAQAAYSFGTQAVGTMSGEQNVTVTAQVAGTVDHVQVLTLGTPNLDFAAGVSALCGTPILAVGGTCTQSVTFTPAYPGVRLGAVVLLDSNEKVLGTTYLSGTGVGGLGVLTAGNVVTVAGVYRNWASTKNGILATLANLNQPASVTLDGAGNMYIAESAHNEIREVSVATGKISTYAGSGDSGYSGDGLAAVNATLTTPYGVALDGAGNLYIADTNNNVVRKVTAAGIISTVAGNGTEGSAGDGSLATLAELNQPRGVTVDASGNLYIADTYNHRIRRVDVLTGNITTVAGNGNPSGNGDGLGTFSGDGGLAINAGLSIPYAVAFDASGNMYIPDSSNNRIRKVAAVNGIIIASSPISTIAGTSAATYSGDGGLATKAALDAPSGVAVDPAGNVYIADTQNARIRKVNYTTGFIASMTVSNSAVVSSTGTLGTAQVYAPMGLFLDGNGNLYYADYFYMIIEKVQSNEAVLNFTKVPIRAGSQSAPQTQTIENDGNADLDLAAFTPDINAALDLGTTTCPLPLPSLLARGASCRIGTVFAPSLVLVFASGVTSQQIDGNVDVYGNTDNFPLNTENFPLDIVLAGIATPVNTTTTTLTSKPNPSNFGQSVTFTATVTSGPTAGNPAGTVTFTDGATQLGTPVTLSASGVATYTAPATSLAVESHTITASFTSATTASFLASTDTLTQNVNEVTATSLSSSKNPSAVGESVTFTATVAISGGGGVTLAGTQVVFTDTTTGTILGSPQTLGASSYQVSVSTAALTQGQHTIVAAYGGDATKNILLSQATLTQDVQASSSILLDSNSNPSTYGMPVIFTVQVPTIGTSAATGTVSILETGLATPIKVTLAGNPATGSFTTSSLPAGPDTLTASYPGDTNYGPSSISISQQVNQAQTSTAVSAALSPGIAGKADAITATVTVTQGAATPTGKVTFTDGSVTLGTVSLGATGTATINPILAPGIHMIVATYAGNANDLGSPGTLALTVNQATTSTAVTASPNPAVVLSPVVFTAKVTGNGGIPGGTVTFSANGTQIGATAALDATGTATITYSGLAAGSYAITAVYSGDMNDQGSTGTGAASLVVGKIPTVTDLGSTTTTGTNPQVILVATVLNSASTTGSASLPTPTGTVTFTSGSTVVGTSPLDSSGIATLVPALGTGTYSIVATYSGDAQHSPSASQAVQVSATATGFNLTVTPASVSMASKQNATVTVALTSTNGFADTVGLGCASLPAGVTCHFSSISAVLKSDAVQSVQLTIDTNNPLSGGSSAMNSRAGKPGTYLAGLLLPFSVFFGWILWRFRKRHAALLSIALVLLLSGAAMLATGCSGMTSSSAAPGTYVIQVTGTGVNSNIIHYQNVTLTITK